MCYNNTAERHIDLLYDATNRHVDVITSMKGLFDARHFCYSCHRAFSTIKHLCSAIGCMLCRQSDCLNRTGFINTSASLVNGTVLFQCDRCHLKLRSLNCLQCHISSGVCHLYTQCPSCNNTVPKGAFSNRFCLKKRCNLCSEYYRFQDRKQNSGAVVPIHRCFVQQACKTKLECSQTDMAYEGNTNNDSPSLQFIHRDAIGEDGLESSVGEGNSIGAKKAKLTVKHDREVRHSLARRSNQTPLDRDIWIFDIETDQSCGNQEVHKPILLLAESLIGEQTVYVGYEFVSEFCQAVFGTHEKVRKTEWFIAHFGSGFDFLPFLEWLFKQHKYIPEVLLRGNKVVSMRVGNKRFIDSYLFILIPLSKFTSTFNLRELKKGYFPHYLTSSEALYPDSREKIHSFQNCVKGVNCRLRQHISRDFSH